MWIWVLFLVYTIMSASGLFLIKAGTVGTGLAFDSGIINFHVTAKLLVGFIVYVCSFLLSVYVMSRMKLSVFYPASTGVVLILTCVLGRLFLKEQIGTPQLVGIALVLSGVIVMNIK